MAISAAAILALSDGWATVLSAGVAAVVSAAVGGVTYVTTLRGHRAEQFRLERELQRTMTVKLYDRRMAAYPEAWRITEKLRRSVMVAEAASTDTAYLKGVQDELDNWAATEAAMILSDDSLHAFYTVRELLRAEPDDGDGRSVERMEAIARSKADLRRELRRDVELLFHEETGGHPLIKPPTTKDAG